MAYLGCVLFGLIFVLMTVGSSGALGARMAETFAWIHRWAPFSYLLLMIVLAAPIASIKIMASWPKHVEPEDPMAKYKHANDVVED